MDSIVSGGAPSSIAHRVIPLVKAWVIKAYTECDRFFIATLLVVVLSYTGVIPAHRIGVRSLLPLESATRIEGRIVSSPFKVSDRNYVSEIELLSQEGSINTVTAQFTARGRISAFLPAKEIEAHYPHGLYSKSRERDDSAVYDTGTIVSLSGKLVGDRASGYTYIAKDMRYKGFRPGLLGKIDYIRAVSRLGFKRLMYRWGDAGALVLALLSGSREYLSGNIKDAFRRAGLSYILALSGMHLGLIAGVLNLIGARTVGKRYAWAVVIAGVVVFIWFAGLSPSLERSFLCLAVGILARLLLLKGARFLDILCLAFLIHRVIAPEEIYTLSFILSYSATLGIALFIDPITKRLSTFMPGWLASPIAMSLSAQIVTVPICLYFFGYINPFSIFASILVLVPITLFMISGSIATLVSMVLPPSVFICGAVMGAQYWVIANIARIFSLAPIIGQVRH